MSQVPNSEPQVLSTAGAITPTRINFLLSTSSPPAALALTLAAPTVDGSEYNFISQDTQTHTLTCTGAGSPPTAGLNGGTTNNRLTWNGTKGSSVTLTSYNGFWYSSAINGVTVS